MSAARVVLEARKHKSQTPNTLDRVVVGPTHFQFIFWFLCVKEFREPTLKGK